MSRGERWDFQQAKQQITRPYNGGLKRKERARRLVRLKAALQKGQLPYTPTVMTWLSNEIAKPSRFITQEDVTTFLKT